MFHGATETEQEFSKVKEWIKAEHPGDVAPRVFGIDFYLQMVSQKGTLAKACAKKLHYNQRIQKLPKDRNSDLEKWLKLQGL